MTYAKGKLRPFLILGAFALGLIGFVLMIGGGITIATILVHALSGEGLPYARAQILLLAALCTFVGWVSYFTADKIMNKISSQRK